MKNKIRGFTLVELLVVVAIIGLLTGMVVISIQNVKAKARDSQRVADINGLMNAIALYHNDYNLYPIYDGYIIGTDDLSNALRGVGSITATPTDPLNTGNYRYYYQSADGKDYYLEYYLETTSIKGKTQGRNYVIP